MLDAGTVAYLDLAGSGVETIAHLRADGRIAVMFCAFEGPPRIVRLHGRGEVVEPGNRGFAELAALFPRLDGTRSVIRVAVERVSDSCGFGVPRMRFEGDRPQLQAWARRKGRAGIDGYKRDHNRLSIDGLPGLASAAYADADATVAPPSTCVPR